MKSLILSIICLPALFQSGWSQDDVPLIDTTSVWFESVTYDGGSPPYGRYSQYWVKGDTIYNGKTYHQLHCSVQNFNSYYDMGWNLHMEYSLVAELPDRVYIREDTLMKTVWMIEFPYDTIETLIYDFSIGLGDTLQFGSIWQVNIVAAIDTVLTANGERKRYHIAQAGYPDDVFAFIIEGIGSTYGLLPDLQVPFESFYNLHCFTNHDQITGFTGMAPIIIDSATVCDFFEPTVTIISTESGDLSIFPNPVTHTLHIQLPELPEGTVTIQVYNSTGRLIKTASMFGNSVQMNMNELIPGIYHIMLDNNGKIYSGLFLKV